MTDVPAGWYDDPEHPEQYRYWDGTSWSEHRAPKKAPPKPSNDAGSMVSEGWNLLWQNWLPILLIGVAFIAVVIVVFVVVAIQANSALDPGLFTILERFAEPGFDPVNDASDEAFVDSISFDASVGFWITVGVGGLLVAIAQGLSIGVAQVHLAAASIGWPLTLGESFATAFRRLPRWIGIYLLWSLVMLVGFAVFAALVFLGVQAPILFLVIIPVAIGLVIYGYPYFWMATTALVIGPQDRPPFRTTVQLIRAAGWRTVAWPVFLANLVIVGINFATGLLGAIPVLGQIIALLVQVLLYALPAALNIPIWKMMGGEIEYDHRQTTAG